MLLQWKVVQQKMFRCIYLVSLLVVVLSSCVWTGVSCVIVPKLAYRVVGRAPAEFTRQLTVLISQSSQQSTHVHIQPHIYIYNDHVLTKSLQNILSRA